MKAKIHPSYELKNVTCSCGMAASIGSTYAKSKEIHLNICSACHPFYTGKNKRVDSAGRVQKFEDKLKRRDSK